MSGISNYFLNLVGDNLSNRSEFPSTVYIALVIAEPFMTSTGSSISEPPSGVGYARQAYTMNSTNWTEASGGAIRNTNTVMFTNNSYGVWGTLVAWVACTASSGGQILFWGTLDVPSSVSTGVEVSLPPNGMEIAVEPPAQALVG